MALQALRTDGNWMMGNTTIFRRQALIEAGGYRADLGPYGDGFVSLVLAVKHGACFVPEPLAVWRRMDGTYSQQSSGNIDAVCRMIDRAEALMRNEYADLFPSDYVDDWKRGMCFGAASALAASPSREAFREMRKLVPDHTFADHVFYGIAGVWPWAGRKVAKPYLFTKLRREHLWSTISRRVLHAATSMSLL